VNSSEAGALALKEKGKKNYLDRTADGFEGKNVLNSEQHTRSMKKKPTGVDGKRKGGGDRKTSSGDKRGRKKVRKGSSGLRVGGKGRNLSRLGHQKGFEGNERGCQGGDRRGKKQRPFLPKKSV